jgi:pyruvate formate lyase activating enzyme
MLGIIFDIKRFAVHDGPGIRTTVFLKGCPLRCRWCHNPESHLALPEKAQKTTILDGKKYVEKEIIGRETSVKEIISEIEKERIIMEESGGGVTISGGEPLMQPLFAKEILHESQAAGFHTAVDTSGYAKREDFELILPYTQLFLYDLKMMDDRLHRQVTGVSNRLILDNFMWLLQQGIKVRVRIPVLRGITYTRDNLDRLGLFLSPFVGKIDQIDLLPYHRTGMNKYIKLGLPCEMPGNEAKPDQEELEELRMFFEKDGHKVGKGG